MLVRLDTGANTRGQDLVGKIVDGRYRIEKIVGRGGMGTVYACRHVVVGKPFAIKVLRPGIERSEEILQRFIREAQAANAVQSRHICQMTDFGQLGNGAFYVVMDLLDGVSLTRALREKRLDRKALKHVFVQIADTLHKAHEADIVHRDLKPDNVVLVDDEGVPNFVKLVDFGIAKMMQSKASNLTETGVILGTPYYMSPEQARGDDLDHRSDIYALGVMMYRAFTGKLPFIADTAMGVLTRHLTEKPQPPSDLTEIDRQLEHLILRCLEKKPIDRFQNMSQVANALLSITDQPQPDIRETLDERTGKGARKRLVDIDPLVDESPTPTPTRLASPMAMSQKREAWDGGNRAQASSAPVPRSNPPPRSSPPHPLSSPPASQNAPRATGQRGANLHAPSGPPHPRRRREDHQPPSGQHHVAPNANPPQHHGGRQQATALPYPHHLTPQAMAAKSGNGPALPPDSASPTHPRVQQHALSHGVPMGHPVHQPVTGSMAAHPGVADGRVAGEAQLPPGEAQLPPHMMGEALTNRGLSARISALPAQPPSKRRWVLAGVAALALVGVGVGAVALSKNVMSPATGSTVSSSTVSSSDVSSSDESSSTGSSDDESTGGEPSADAKPTPPPAELPAIDPDATSSAAPNAPSASAAHSSSDKPPIAPVAPRSPVPSEGEDEEEKPKPKPVDDVRDPFDE